MSTPNTIAIPPEIPDGFEPVAVIKMPCPLNGFSKFLGLAGQTWKGSRLLPYGQWAFIIAPIDQSKMGGRTVETSKTPPLKP